MAQSGVNKSTKKDPVVKSNEINTFNQPNYNTELVALEANKLAKKYSNLLVTNGPEGRKSANKAKDEIGKFIKKNETDFKEKKKQAMKVIKAMKNQLDEALAPAVEVHDELDELIKESQNAQHEAQDAENRQIAHEMAKNLGVAPGLVDKIIDYKNKALYPLGTGKLKRERYIADKLGYAMKYGVQVGKNTLDATTAEVILKEVKVTVRGRCTSSR
ncbi:hypothetical protein [Ligilactobacillus saerimneri]